MVQWWREIRNIWKKISKKLIEYKYTVNVKVNLWTLSKSIHVLARLLTLSHIFMEIRRNSVCQNNQSSKHRMQSDWPTVSDMNWYAATSPGGKIETDVEIQRGKIGTLCSSDVSKLSETVFLKVLLTTWSINIFLVFWRFRKTESLTRAGKKRKNSSYNQPTWLLVHLLHRAAVDSAARTLPSNRSPRSTSRLTTATTGEQTNAGSQAPPTTHSPTHTRC